MMTNRTDTAPATTLLSTPAAVTLHLLPGVALAAFAAATAPTLRAAGLPPIWGLLLGVPIVLAPIVVGWLAHVRRSTGLPAVVWQPLPRRRFALVTAATTLTCLILPGAVVWLEQPLAARLAQWLPWWKPLSAPALDGAAPAVRVATLMAWLVILVIVGPVIEECWFRGYLLPRLRGGPVAVVVQHAALFACYHLWQPQAWLTVFVFALPLSWVVARTRNVGVSIVAHCVVNAVTFAGLLAGAFAGR